MALTLNTEVIGASGLSACERKRAYMYHKSDSRSRTGVFNEANQWWGDAASLGSLVTPVDLLNHNTDEERKLINK